MQGYTLTANQLSLIKSGTSTYNYIVNVIEFENVKSIQRGFSTSDTVTFSSVNLQKSIYMVNSYNAQKDEYGSVLTDSPIFSFTNTQLRLTANLSGKTTYKQILCWNIIEFE